MARTALVQTKARQGATAVTMPPPPTVGAAELTAAVDPVEAAMAAASVGLPQLLKPAEVAERLGVGERTLERWRGTGEGPRYVSLTRKTVRYDAAAIASFIAGRVKASTAQ